jgi:hypothetical protein
MPEIFALVIIVGVMFGIVALSVFGFISWFVKDHKAGEAIEEEEELEHHKECQCGDCPCHEDDVEPDENKE